MKAWFWIDVFASFPYDYILNDIFAGDPNATDEGG